VPTLPVSKKPDVVVLQEVMFPGAEVPGGGRDRSKLSGKGKTFEAQKAILERSFREGGVFENYTVKYSLSDKKYAGTALLVRKTVEKPISIRYNLDMGAEAGVHDEEGRVIFSEFDRFFLLMTYTPNNGGKKVVVEGVEVRQKTDSAYLLAPCALSHALLSEPLRLPVDGVFQQAAGMGCKGNQIRRGNRNARKAPCVRRRPQLCPHGL